MVKNIQKNNVSLTNQLSILRQAIFETKCIYQIYTKNSLELDLWSTLFI